jgi:hypothetical protein
MSDDDIDPVIAPLQDRLAEELDAAQRNALARGEVIEPNEDEKKNGWTTETLTAYLTERRAGQSLAVDVNSLQRRLARRPDETNHNYSPHRWRS